MGNDQPKPIARVTKAQIDIASLKARIHLQLFRDRKNGEVVKTEKELVAKIKGKNRNKTEEILIAERVIQGLKYASACNLLMGYASNLRLQAQFISENMLNPLKMQPFLIMIYSLIYAADQLGLSSLTEFKNLMRALNNPIALQKYVNPQIVAALAPTPTAQELNIYMLQFSERNAIPLQEINAGGHKFTQEKNIPSIPPSSSNFTEIQKRLAEDLKNKFGGSGGFGGQGGMGGTERGYNPYQNVDPRQFRNDNGDNNCTPQIPYYPTNNFSFGPKPNPNDPLASDNGDTSNRIPANLGPNIYVPPEVAAKKKSQQVRANIEDVNQIGYYPELDAKPVVFNKAGLADPEFDKICERLRQGL